jgi:hypothetical protein
MNLAAEAARLRAGAGSVTFATSGSSMEPRVRSGATVTVTALAGAPRKGDVVLAKVKGRWYLHLVTGVRKGQVQISNNKGHVNGWTTVGNIVGRLES